MKYLISIKNRQVNEDDETRKKNYNEYHRDYQRKYYELKYKRDKEYNKYMKEFKFIYQNWQEFCFDYDLQKNAKIKD